MTDQTRAANREFIESLTKRIAELKRELQETADNYETQLVNKDLLLAKYERHERLPSEIYAACGEALRRWEDGTRLLGCDSFSGAFREGYEASHEDAQKRIADALTLTPEKIEAASRAAGLPCTSRGDDLAKAALLAAGLQEPEEQQ